MGVGAKDVRQLRGRLWVVFEGEEGLDFGGVSREWFSLGRKSMSCSLCQELGQQASRLLIGCTRVNNQSEARVGS